MGSLSDLIDFTKLASMAPNKPNGDPNDLKVASELFRKAKSISAAASRYVLDYPVAVTESVTTFKTGIAIAKQIEINCARYIILTCGLNPVIDTRRGDSISAHLQALTTSFESYSGKKVTLSIADEAQRASCEQWFSENRSLEDYVAFKPKTSFLQSQEILEGENAVIDDGIVDTGDDEEVVMDRDWLESLNNTVRMDFKKYLDSNNLNWDTLDEARRSEVYDNFQISIQKYKPSMPPADIQKLDRTGPTIVNINFILDSPGGQKEIPIPVAIKASLQFLPREDVQQILRNVESKSTRFQNFIKVTTGQMSFFKDILCQLEEARGDIAREKQLGNIPFYRNLTAAKNKYRLKHVLGIIPVLKGMIGKKTQKDMPMCTIAITASEITEATGLKLAYLIKNRKFIEQMIDTYMLLCLCIFDETQEIVYFFFSGEDQPQIRDIKTIGNSAGADSTKEMSGALHNMTKWMARR